MDKNGEVKPTAKRTGHDGCPGGAEIAIANEIASANVKNANVSECASGATDATKRVSGCGGRANARTDAASGTRSTIANAASIAGHSQRATSVRSRASADAVRAIETWTWNDRDRGARDR